MFSQKLNDAIIAKNSRLCVGIDPRLELLPDGIGITKFNKQILEAVAKHAACVKLQSAFFELHHEDGIKSFWNTANYAKSLGLLVIADVKRGDIGSTAEAYAEAYLGHPAIDAVTVNPFLGADSLEPFFDAASKHQKGVFVLVKTSNAGSGDLQDLEINGQSISEKVAQMILKKKSKKDQHGYGLHGAVIGATYPKVAQKFRKLLPKSIFLVPGIGAQGGDPTLLKYFFDKNKLGAVVNSSRGVVFSYQKNDPNYLKVIENAAKETKDLINKNL